MSDIDTGVADSLKALDPDGRLERADVYSGTCVIAEPAKKALDRAQTTHCSGGATGHFAALLGRLPRWTARCRSGMLSDVLTSH